jgi:hypothetical protein
MSEYERKDKCIEIWEQKESFSGSEIVCETNLEGVKLYETS